MDKSIEAAARAIYAVTTGHEPRDSAETLERQPLWHSSVKQAQAAIAVYRDAEIERLKQESAGNLNAANYWKRNYDDLRAKLEAAERRLYWLAITDMGIDQIGEIDLHEAAYVNAVDSGREEPNDSDMLAALSYAIDAARGGERG